jgi:hypothetical protein
MEINMMGNYAQLARTLLNPIYDISVEGRGTGKSYDIGLCMDKLNRCMPKGIFAITGKTYGQILNRVLPSALKALGEIGYEKNIHYIIGKKPPNWYHDSYEKLSKFDNVISFANGVR